MPAQKWVMETIVFLQSHRRIDSPEDRTGKIVCISCTVTRSTVTEHCFVVSTSRTGKLSRVVALGS
jgi:hypothetical protein